VRTILIHGRYAQRTLHAYRTFMATPIWVKLGGFGLGNGLATQSKLLA